MKASIRLKEDGARGSPEHSKLTFAAFVYSWLHFKRLDALGWYMPFSNDSSLGCGS